MKIGFLLLLLASPLVADEIVGQRLYHLNTKDSAGVVVNRTYRRCHWPKTDVPLRPFAAGSSGIQVEGPPTPRNIVFPVGTVFLNGTNGISFSTSTTTNQDVLEDQTFTTDAVIDGQLRRVTYTRPVTVNKPVKNFHLIDETTARTLAQ